MLKSLLIRGGFLAVGVLFFNFLFSINDINANSSSDKGTGISTSVRRITNDFSNLPQFETFDQTVNEFLKRWEIAGASIAVVNDGKLLYAKGFGKANEEYDINVQPEHLFRVASISKLVTAVTIMKMEESGLLSIDDKVFGKTGILSDSVYLSYRDRNLEKITIRHLLEHSAGWSTRGGDPMFMHTQIATVMGSPLPVSDNTIIQYVLKHHRLYFEPGTRSYYSNVGYVILGKVIEKISGIPYEDYVRQKILFPMGIYAMKIGKNFYHLRDINESAYYDREGAELRMACDGSGQLVPRPYGGTDISTLGAAGGWIASSIDLMKLMVYIDGYSNVIDFLDPQSNETLTCPRESYLSPLGWRETDGNGNWWRTGTLAGTSTLLVRQNDGISYVVLLNTSTWKGARFTKEINRMMTKALGQVDVWPDTDLFKLNLPDHQKPISPNWWVSNILKY